MEEAKIVYAIIPARGGSKGLSQKNVKLLAGKPLIAYSIEAAFQCPGISRCFVSTEDAKIKQVSLDFGVEVIDRPEEYATDQSQTHEVVRHALEELKGIGNIPDYFILLQPTSPLRTSKHIQSCMNAFFASDVACVISVTETDHHPYKDFVVENGLLQPLFDVSSVEKRRQALPEVFRPNGAIYMMSSQLFIEKNSFFVPPALPFLMDREASIDIDTAFDLLMAELILKGQTSVSIEQL